MIGVTINKMPINKILGKKSRKTYSKARHNMPITKKIIALYLNIFGKNECNFIN